ncbi:Cut9-interacting protein scn1 [Coniothyrium glycines]
MASQARNDGEFPWHLGVYDAHCHPTDTMSSIATIQDMKARCLTVMATRGEDQDLVISSANKYGIKSSNAGQWSPEECIVPCFGWHPWFSHQMYLSLGNDNEEEQGNLQGEAKIKHYQQVLQPFRDQPSEEDRQIFLSLPDPTPFSKFLSQTRQHLQHFPYALVGEIGLDRSFRIPESWTTTPDLWSTRNHALTPGGREGRRLTPFRCSPQHQTQIFTLQLQLAASLGRAVSVHGVQAHGLVLSALSSLWHGHEVPVLSKRERKKRGLDHPSVASDFRCPSDAAVDEGAPKPYPPRICLHSYSGNVSNFKMYLNPAIPARIFASFSTAINLADTLEGETPDGFVELVKTVPDHMLLVESDLHVAGEDMDGRLEDIVRRICRIKGWGLEEGVERLGKNWRAFVFGHD